MGSITAHHVIACSAFGCSLTAENTRITYDPLYDPTTPHLCYHPPEIESAKRVGATLVMTGRGFGAGAPFAIEAKTLFVYASERRAMECAICSSADAS